MSQENPFAAPQADLTAPPANPYPFAPSAPIYVQGNEIVIRSGTVLPPRCVKTNAPVSQKEMRKRKMYYCNPMLALTVLISPVIYVILYLVLRKRCDVTFGHETSRHRVRFWLKVIGAILFFLSFFGMMGFAIEANRSELAAGMTFACGFVMFVSLIALLIVGQPVIRPVRHLDGWFWFRGFSPDYLAEVAATAPQVPQMPPMRR